MRVLQFAPGEVRALPGIPLGDAGAGWLWVDCEHDEAGLWPAPVSALTGVTVFEDHLLDAGNRQHPSHFVATRDYEMIIFRGLASAVSPDEGTAPLRIRTRPTVFFLFPGCLVTLHAPDSRTVPALRERLLAERGPRQRLPDSPEELMLRLLNGMVDRYLELRQPLTAQLDRWQRLLLDPRRPFQDWLALLEARGELRKLEHLCEEQLDAIQEWRDERLDQTRADPGRPGIAHPPGFVGIADPLRVRTGDLIEHVHRVLNHTRRLEASLESAVQLHFSSTAHRTNEIMRTLTTLTAVFMPLTLITGIFGMNFEVIPGTRAPAGFWWAVATMALIAAVMLAYFRARRFLSSPERLARRSHPKATAGEHERDPE